MAARLLELNSRDLIDGSGISITLFQREGTDEFIVEAANERWAASVLVNGEQALEAFEHPFSREGWIDYPGINTDSHDARLRPLSRDEYAILEALEAVDSEVEASA